jgi:phage terminase large subunit
MPSNIVIPEPNDKQRLFFIAKNRYIAYGGARGGGKSWAVRQKSKLLALNYPGIKILILRRTYPELRENHIIPMMADLKGIAQYREIDKAFLFGNGSRIKFGYCDSESDLTQYQGNEYDVMFVDEATQIPEAWYNVLKASIRGVNNYPKRMYLTCNPGGVGHEWVKRLFVDRKYINDERPEDYLFIKATVYDNKPLMEQDKDYVRNLETLPDDLRRAWLDGDWNLFAGQYFTEWREDIHVFEPFDIPSGWRRYFAMDYGLDMLAGYWIAVDDRGKAYVYREVYQSNLIMTDAADLIKSMTSESIYAHYAPPDLYNRRQDTGRSVADVFASKGMPLIKAQNNRVQGWLDLKEWLKPYEDNGAMTASIKVSRACPNLIRSIPALQFDKHNASDVATEPHEYTHGPDALRYFVAGRPTPTYRAPVQKPDPFNLRPKPSPLGQGGTYHVI